jgi:predicted acyl esterase
MACAAAGAPTTGFEWHDITAHDGVTLKSNVIAPATPGRHPGIVFVASWGLNDYQYLVPARKLAQAGYVVLAYCTRGFWSSGGAIDVAGPNDVADASSAVDWLIGHTAVNADRIGIVGLSYGGGISLLAAAHDKRIRAVASMSGWADLEASMYGGNTRRPQAAFFLQAVADLVGRPSPEMNRILADYWADRDAAGRAAWARARSARYDVDAINRNRPAVLMTQAYGDSIFPANQMVDFYDRLSTPKRLELAPGDHATVELPGLVGLPDHAWTSLRDWFDRYLRGVDDGGAANGVVLRPHGSAVVETYPDWAHVSTGGTRLGLGPGETMGAGQGSWTDRITAGTDTTADAGVALLSNGLEQLTGVPPLVALPTVSRTHAAVWQSARYATPVAVRGVPELHLTMTAPPAGTVVAYLYDVNSLGVGRLVAHAPASWLSARDTLDIPLQVTAFDLAAGHRLAVVVDTRDPLYLAAGGDAAITFRGDSWLELPTR